MMNMYVESNACTGQYYLANVLGKYYTCICTANPTQTRADDLGSLDLVTATAVCIRVIASYISWVFGSNLVVVIGYVLLLLVYSSIDCVNSSTGYLNLIY